MSKKSKVRGLNEPFLHQDQRRPSTRREFLARGFLTGAGAVIAPTLAGMLAYPRAAQATLACRDPWFPVPVQPEISSIQASVCVTTPTARTCAA